MLKSQTRLQFLFAQHLYKSIYTVTQVKQTLKQFLYSYVHLFYMLTMSKKLKRLQCSNAAAFFDLYACPGRRKQLLRQNLPNVSKELSCSGAKTSIRNLMEIKQARNSIRPVQLPDTPLCNTYNPKKIFIMICCKNHTVRPMA